MDVQINFTTKIVWKPGPSDFYRKKEVCSEDFHIEPEGGSRIVGKISSFNDNMFKNFFVKLNDPRVLNTNKIKYTLTKETKEASGVISPFAPPNYLALSAEELRDKIVEVALQGL